MRIALALAVAACTMAAADGPGLTRVPYDGTEIPELVCSVVFGCEVVLEPGERLRLASLFDERWSAKVADDGATGTAPRVLIVPTAAEEGAVKTRRPLRTALELLTTRREYVVHLTATARAEAHRLGFTYAQAPVVVRLETPTPAPSPSVGTSGIDPSALDFGWTASGDASLRCAGVFSTSSQVWCQLPAATPGVPAAYRVEGLRRTPLPFHVLGRYLVIDAAVSPIALVLGGTPERTALLVRGH